MLAIQNLPPGAKLRLKQDKAVAEVVENPGDGAWLLVRRVEPARSGTGEELCHVDDILELL